jgi:small neutral amino acid transporter SnatA (MarC family)
MTGWFVFLAYLAAVNPPRLRPHLAAGQEPGRPEQLALGAAIVIGAGLMLVLAADGILDALDVTDETWRLATGVVCGLVGARTVVAPRLGEMPSPGGLVLIPIAFPLLFTAQLAVLAILFGATESFASAWGWLAVGVGAGVAVGRLRYRRAELWLASARLLGTALLVVGVALVIAGIRDV